MKSATISRVAGFASLLLLAFSPFSAQVERASLVGTVTDSSGALIPGGWEIAAILVMQSGLPFTLLAPSATNNGATSRGNVVGGISPYPSVQTLQQWFNPAAFSVPPATCYC